MTRSDLALVLPDLRLGGAQRVATNLVRAWCDRGRAVTVITFSGAETDFFPLDPRANRVALGLQAPSGSLMAAVRANLRRATALRRAIQATGAPRVLSFVAGTNVMAVAASLGLGLRTVISERNDPARQNIGALWEALRTLTYRFADVVTANSVGAISALGRFVPAAKLRLLPNGIAPQAGAAAPVARERIFLAVGRLNRQKAYPVLLRALAATRARCPGWRLVVLGDGEDRGILTSMAAELGVSELVEWCGAVADPSPYYRRAGVFVIPSLFEGTPNAMLEAMASGIPVIASDAVSDVRATIADSGAGLVVPSGDHVALGDAMCELAADESLRLRMGIASAAAVAGQSLDEVLAQWDLVLGFPA